MSERRRQRQFWRLADALGYLLTLAWLRILDALAGPTPATPADQQRQRQRERIERAFPNIGGAKPGAAVAHRADRVRCND